MFRRTLLGVLGCVVLVASPKTTHPQSYSSPTFQSMTVIGSTYYVNQFGQHNDFIGDDGPAIQAALNAAKAGGGGTVYLDQKPYWNQTVALSVPQNVTLRCIGYFSKSLSVGNPDPAVYQTFPCTIFQKAGTSLDVLGSLTNAGVFQDQVHFQNVSSRATRALTEAYINGFTGIGVNVHQHQVTLDNLLIGGFATCISTINANQNSIRNILGDCTNGLNISQSFDDNWLNNLEFWEWITVGTTHVNDHWTITNLADNGAGLWRVTISAPDTTLVTGEKIWISPGASAQGAGGLWTITVIDSTHFDLQGSADGPITTTGTTSFLSAQGGIGYTYVTVGSTNNLAPGMSVSGPGIPAGATVAAVWRSRAAISLDQAHPALAAASNITLTITNQPYSGTGGVAFYDANWRTGTGFAIGRADGTMCSQCFAFGFQTGFLFQQAVGVGFINAQYDQGAGQTAIKLANQNVTPIGVRFSTVGTTPAYSNIWKGSMIVGNGVLVYSDLGAAGGQAAIGNTVEVDRLASSSLYATYVESASGGLIVKNAVASQAGNILLDASTRIPFFIGNLMPLTTIYSTVYQPVMLFGQNQFGGQDESRSSNLIMSGRFRAAAVGSASYDMYSASRPADEKIWRWQATGATGSTACLQTADDAYTIPTNALCASRSGTTPTNLSVNEPLTVQSYTIAGLPTCGASLKGAIAYVSNGQTTPPYLGAVSTTGAVVAPVFCNGSGWVYH